MKRSYIQEIYKLFTSLRTSRDAEQALKDLLTPAELEEVAERWQIVKLLAEGVPQRKISKALKVSIAKVTRGSHALQHSAGGFRRFLTIKAHPK